MGSIISIFILWCLYAMFEGWREGILFHKTEFDKPAGKILHINFTIQRAFILGIILIGNFEWWVASLPLVFVFLHDGQFKNFNLYKYYTTRNKYNRQIYTNKWFSQSSTSTAWSTKFLTPAVRTIMFIAGIGVLVVYLLQKL